MAEMTTADALEWLASVLDADGRDPLPCDRMMLTLVLLLAAQVRDLTAEVERLRAEVTAMRRDLAYALEVVL